MKKDAKIDDALCTICEFSDSCDNLVLASVVSCTERTKCVCGARGAEANGKSISSDIKHIILISTFPFFYVMLVCYSYDRDSTLLYELRWVCKLFYVCLEQDIYYMRFISNKCIHG